MTTNALGKPPTTAIEIPYRDEGNGGGAFYDHFTFQKATKRETKISVPDGMTISSLQSHVKTEGISAMPFGKVTADGKTIPRILKETDRVGLLVITGHARETEKKRPAALQLRETHEHALLKKALLEGRPVLGVCAGSWQIWSFLGGDLEEVKDHAWERMPAITSKGKVGHNIQMHNVNVEAQSMFAGALSDDTRYIDEHPTTAPLKDLEEIHPSVTLTVNSVHWKAPDADTLPLGIAGRPKVCVVGTAEQNDDVAPHRASGAVFKHPTEGTVEVFEQQYGAPMLGIQWHPEAYNDDGTENSARHRSALNYMAKAGDAFCAKRTMIDSFKEEFDDVVSRLENVSLD